MLVGIHIDQYEKFSPFLQQYERILDHNNIRHIKIDASELDFWEKIKTLDFFIFRWLHTDWARQLAHTILPIVESELKIKCFPNQATCWHFDDKIREYYLLKQHNYPIIESYIFWDKIKAIKWAAKTDYPQVFKLSRGAGSTNVLLIKNKEQAFHYIKKMFGKGINPNGFSFLGSVKHKDFNLYKTIRHWGRDILRRYKTLDIHPNWEIHKNYILFQKFIPNNNYDTRVTVIGNRAYAFRRFNRKNDFRSSGSGIIDYDINKIDLQFVELALKISKEMNFQSMAYDFLYNKNDNPVFCEISYTYVDSAVYECPGYWDSTLNWHEGHYWPQYFQLKDLLELPNLKQP